MSKKQPTSQEAEDFIYKLENERQKISDSYDQEVSKLDREYQSYNPSSEVLEAAKRKQYDIEQKLAREQIDRDNIENNVDTTERKSKLKFNKDGSLYQDSDTKLFFKDLWNETLGSAISKVTGENHSYNAYISGQKVSIRNKDVFSNDTMDDLRQELQDAKEDPEAKHMFYMKKVYDGKDENGNSRFKYKGGTTSTSTWERTKANIIAEGGEIAFEKRFLGAEDFEFRYNKAVVDIGDNTFGLGRGKDGGTHEGSGYTEVTSNDNLGLVNDDIDFYDNLKKSQNEADRIYEGGIHRWTDSSGVEQVKKLSDDYLTNFAANGMKLLHDVGDFGLTVVGLPTLLFADENLLKDNFFDKWSEDAYNNYGYDPRESTTAMKESLHAFKNGNYVQGIFNNIEGLVGTTVQSLPEMALYMIPPLKVAKGVGKVSAQLLNAEKALIIGQNSKVAPSVLKKLTKDVTLQRRKLALMGPGAKTLDAIKSSKAVYGAKKFMSELGLQAVVLKQTNNLIEERVQAGDKDITLQDVFSVYASTAALYSIQKMFETHILSGNSITQTGINSIKGLASDITPKTVTAIAGEAIKGIEAIAAKKIFGVNFTGKLVSGSLKRTLGAAKYATVMSEAIAMEAGEEWLQTWGEIFSKQLGTNKGDDSRTIYEAITNIWNNEKNQDEAKMASIAGGVGGVTLKTVGQAYHGTKSLFSKGAELTGLASKKRIDKNDFNNLFEPVDTDSISNTSKDFSADYIKESKQNIDDASDYIYRHLDPNDEFVIDGHTPESLVDEILTNNSDNARNEIKRKSLLLATRRLVNDMSSYNGGAVLYLKNEALASAVKRIYETSSPDEKKLFGLDSIHNNTSIINAKIEELTTKGSMSVDPDTKIIKLTEDARSELEDLKKSLELSSEHMNPSDKVYTETVMGLVDLYLSGKAKSGDTNMEGVKANIKETGFIDKSGKIKLSLDMHKKIIKSEKKTLGKVSENTIDRLLHFASTRGKVKTIQFLSHSLAAQVDMENREIEDILNSELGDLKDSEDKTIPTKIKKALDALRGTRFESINSILSSRTKDNKNEKRAKIKKNGKWIDDPKVAADAINGIAKAKTLEDLNEAISALGSLSSEENHIAEMYFQRVQELNGNIKKIDLEKDSDIDQYIDAISKVRSHNDLAVMYNKIMSTVNESDNRKILVQHIANIKKGFNKKRVYDYESIVKDIIELSSSAKEAKDKLNSYAKTLILEPRDYKKIKALVQKFGIEETNREGKGKREEYSEVEDDSDLRSLNQLEKDLDDANKLEVTDANKAIVANIRRRVKQKLDEVKESIKTVEKSISKYSDAISRIQKFYLYGKNKLYNTKTYKDFEASFKEEYKGKELSIKDIRELSKQEFFKQFEDKRTPTEKTSNNKNINKVDESINSSNGSTIGKSSPIKILHELYSSYELKQAKNNSTGATHRAIKDVLEVGATHEQLKLAVVAIESLRQNNMSHLKNDIDLLKFLIKKESDGKSLSKAESKKLKSLQDNLDPVLGVNKEVSEDVIDTYSTNTKLTKGRVRKIIDSLRQYISRLVARLKGLNNERLKLEALIKTLDKFIATPNAKSENQLNEDATDSSKKIPFKKHGEGKTSEQIEARIKRHNDSVDKIIEGTDFSEGSTYIKTQIGTLYGYHQYAKDVGNLELQKKIEDYLKIIEDKTGLFIKDINEENRGREVSSDRLVTFTEFINQDFDYFEEGSGKTLQITEQLTPTIYKLNNDGTIDGSEKGRVIWREVKYDKPTQREQDTTNASQEAKIPQDAIDISRSNIEESKQNRKDKLQNENTDSLKQKIRADVKKVKNLSGDSSSLRDSIRAKIIEIAKRESEKIKDLQRELSKTKSIENRKNLTSKKRDELLEKIDNTLKKLNVSRELHARLLKEAKDVIYDDTISQKELNASRGASKRDRTTDVSEVSTEIVNSSNGLFRGFNTLMSKLFNLDKETPIADVEKIDSSIAVANDLFGKENDLDPTSGKVERTGYNKEKKEFYRTDDPDAELNHANIFSVGFIKDMIKIDGFKERLNLASLSYIAIGKAIQADLVSGNKQKISQDFGIPIDEVSIFVSDASRGYIPQAMIRKKAEQMIMELLGIKFESDVPYNTQQIVSKGLLALVESQLVKSDKVLTSKFETKTSYGKNYMTINVNHIKGHKVHEVASDFKEIEFLSESNDRKKPSRKPVFIEEGHKIIRSDIEITEDDRTLLNKNNAIKWSFDGSIDDFAKEYHSGADGQKNVLESFGWKTIDYVNQSSDSIATDISNNEKIEREAEVMFRNEAEFGKDDMHIEWGITKNSRANMRSEMNPQESKIHREFLGNKSYISTISTMVNNFRDAVSITYDNFTNSEMFEMSLAQAFDLDPDKLGKIGAFKAIRNIVDIYGDTVRINVPVDNGNNKDVIEFTTALDKFIRSQSIDFGSLAIIFKTGNMHGVKAAIELKRLQQSKNNLDENFTTSLTFETDAITSGPALSFFQIKNEASFKILEKAGVYTDESKSRLEKYTKYLLAMKHNVSEDDIEFTAGALIEAGKYHQNLNKDIKDDNGNNVDLTHPIKIGNVEHEMFADLYTHAGLKMAEGFTNDEKLKSLSETNEIVQDMAQKAKDNIMPDGKSIDPTKVRKNVKPAVVVKNYGSGEATINNELSTPMSGAIIQEQLLNGEYDFLVDMLTLNAEKDGMDMTSEQYSEFKESSEYESKREAIMDSVMYNPNNYTFYDKDGNVLDKTKSDIKAIFENVKKLKKEIDENKNITSDVNFHELEDNYIKALEELKSVTSKMHISSQAVTSAYIASNSFATSNLASAFENIFGDIDIVTRMTKNTDYLTSKIFDMKFKKAMKEFVVKNGREPTPKDISDIIVALDKSGFGHSIHINGEVQPLYNQNKENGTNRSIININNNTSSVNTEGMTFSDNTGASAVIPIHRLDGRLIRKALETNDFTSIYDAIIMGSDHSNIKESNSVYNKSMVSEALDNNIAISYSQKLNTMLSKLTEDEISELLEDYNSFEIQEDSQDFVEHKGKAYVDSKGKFAIYNGQDKTSKLYSKTQISRNKVVTTEIGENGATTMEVSHYRDGDDYIVKVSRVAKGVTSNSKGKYTGGEKISNKGKTEVDGEKHNNRQVYKDENGKKFTFGKYNPKTKKAPRYSIKQKLSGEQQINGTIEVLTYKISNSKAGLLKVDFTKLSPKDVMSKLTSATAKVKPVKSSRNYPLSEIKEKALSDKAKLMPTGASKKAGFGAATGIGIANHYSNAMQVLKDGEQHMQDNVPLVHSNHIFINGTQMESVTVFNDELDPSKYDIENISEVTEFFDKASIMNIQTVVRLTIQNNNLKDSDFEIRRDNKDNTLYVEVKDSVSDMIFENEIDGKFDNMFKFKRKSEDESSTVEGGSVFTHGSNKNKDVSKNASKKRTDSYNNYKDFDFSKTETDFDDSVIKDIISNSDFNFNEKQIETILAYKEDKNKGC